MKAGAAINSVKKVDTTTGGRFSGSLNLCCISGLAASIVHMKHIRIVIASNAIDSVL